VREQRRVDTLLESAAVADEMEPETGSLPLGPHRRVGQPDRRHQLATAELGQHPGVDPVVLQASGASPFTFNASAISTCQPATSS
jgi:hypothetical protein